jgi:uncharacterized protein (TIGR04141 family)
MPRTTGVSTNRLTIYQIKSKFKTIEDIVDTKAKPIEVGGVGSFIFEPSHPAPPAWITKFFGTGLDRTIGILVSSAKALLLVPIKDKKGKIFFAIVFGQGRHLLRDGVVEDRYGLRIVLNSIGDDSFRSIDKTSLGAIPKHSREQMSRDVSPSEFGIDIEQDLVSSVTAKSSDDRFGKIITGKDALHISARVDISNVSDFLSYSLSRTRSNDYKSRFDWIDQIAAVRNPTIEDDLNSRLVQRIGSRRLEKIWMAVPQIIDWAAVSGFRYIRPKRGDLKDDLTLEAYLEASTDIELSLDSLKSHQVYPISAEDGNQMDHWSAFRCMYAEIEARNKLYILNNGNWYEIARDFSEVVQNDFISIPDSDIALPDYTTGGELEYNTEATARLGNACCMDQKTIVHGGGHSKIEFCDILTSDKKLIHVKKYSGSSVLSHLFMQGAVSGELLVADAEFRMKLNRELPRGHKLLEPRRRPNPADFEIVYAIISASRNPLNIPFFSKVSLRSARRRLVSYGYQVTKKKVQTA